ncbi:hypothetical protein OHB26_21970 [Nocardia sp. NBC_01503]|uniref:hypothetical protein n=1 Tax=Nocardia sp. NBC_01503 TaxID=2975997 RepID=UPI002E7BC56E|nr:hypothetical protein [Nocardia sp. NBC_01503]WTL29648.1 hypothetical protein OHB26_21970 [Nocardia sp. NBC_01503]
MVDGAENCERTESERVRGAFVRRKAVSRKEFPKNAYRRHITPVLESIAPERTFSQSKDQVAVNLS